MVSLNIYTNPPRSIIVSNQPYIQPKGSIFCTFKISLHFQTNKTQGLICSQHHSSLLMCPQACWGVLCPGNSSGKVDWGILVRPFGHPGAWQCLILKCTSPPNTNTETLTQGVMQVYSHSHHILSKKIMLHLDPWKEGMEPLTSTHSKSCH